MRRRMGGCGGGREGGERMGEDREKGRGWESVRRRGEDGEEGIGWDGGWGRSVGGNGMGWRMGRRAVHESMEFYNPLLILMRCWKFFGKDIRVQVCLVVAGWWMKLYNAIWIFYVYYECSFQKQPDLIQ